jgi:cytochrome P450
MKSIPGERGLPVLGHSLRFLKDCNVLINTMHQRYGPVYYNYYLYTKVIGLLSPDANEFVLLDRDKNFSSRKAWNISLAELFPNGLMLRDGDEHRYHRRLLGAPFKAKALEEYVGLMDSDIASTVAKWPHEQSIQLYPLMKQLTLDLAAKVFLGEDLVEEAGAVNTAFVDVVDASMALIRHPWLGAKYRRGLKGRALLEDYFTQRIAGKRASQDTDMFAEISRVEDEQGTRFSEQDVIDHIIFLMMAAHDTTTSSLSSIAFALAKHPEWQDQIAEQSRTLGDDSLQYAQMPEFTSAEWVFKEALRLYPPLPIIPRSAVKDCEFQGFEIKRGDMVHLSPTFTQRMSTIWTDPERFDPTRFGPDRAEDRNHKHAFVPFGGGAHKCLGIKFAELQVKLVMFHLLRHFRLEVSPDYEMPYAPAPIGKPKDLLPIILRPV